MGILYLVATPIGNLEDISARALRVLREARLIAAEDTRVTRRLLTHFEIHTPLTSYFEHNKLSKLDLILSELGLGDVALVSDAGTPAINDPGFELVKAALGSGHTVSPIPGPSAPIAALAASGLPTDSFLYMGYFPRKSSERRSLLERVAALPHTLIFLETPHRLLDALADLQAVLGNRQMAAARELTKLHEEIARGTVETVRAKFEREEPRGEFTLVIAGQAAGEREPRWSDDKVAIAIKVGLRLGEPPAKLAGRLAKESGVPRQEIYDRIRRVKHPES
jgi:16S rRNA (cytidine1402-2'-O)-methyltransferase